MQGAKVKVGIDLDALGEEIAEMSAHIAAIKRALLLRDRTYRFPGCSIAATSTVTTLNIGQTAVKPRWRILCCYAVRITRCCTKAAAELKQTVLMAGIFLIIVTESSTRNRLAQHRTQRARSVVSQRCRMPMWRLALRRTPTYQNGPASRSTMRGASIIWCEALRAPVLAQS